MDVLSHAVLPFAAYALLLRRPQAERLAAGLGAAAPDIDALFTWVARLGDPLYAFTHRGWSHTLWGAPLLGMLAIAVAAHPLLVKRWPRLAAFKVTQATLLAASLGALSHLFLDALTITGIPALWPLSNERFTLNLFFFSVPYMALVSGYALWRLHKRTLHETVLRRVAVVLVAMLLASGALRAASMPPDPAPGAVVLPGPLEWRWFVAEPFGSGWAVQEVGFGGPGPLRVYTGNASVLSSDAVRSAQALGAYTAWAWSHAAPVVNATAIENGWRVEFRDAVGMHRNATSALGVGLFGEAKPLAVEVVRGEARVVQWPGGYGLG